MLNVWYWLLAKGETDFEFNPSMASINKPVPQVSASSYLPTDGESLVLWLDANDSGSLTLNGDVVSQWDDQSGNERHAVLENGTPSLSPNIGVNGMPSISFRRENGDDLLNISGTGFFAKHMFFICRSPNESWNGYGGILAHQSGRSSNYLLQSGGTNFHSYQYPAFVSKNGNMLSQTNGFDMSPITNFMILEIVVNANSEMTKQTTKWAEAITQQPNLMSSKLLPLKKSFHHPQKNKSSTIYHSSQEFLLLDKLWCRDLQPPLLEGLIYLIK